MRYLTTRDQQEIFTAYRALTDDSAPNGGLFIPEHFPYYEPSELTAMVEKPVGELAARILNELFSANLNADDIDFCIGKSPVHLTRVGRKTMVAETWHTPGRSYDHAVSDISSVLLSPLKAPVSSWTRIAAGIVFAFCAYAQLRSQRLVDCEDVVDFCVPDGDYSLPVAMLYAGKMGLPVGKIVICSGKNSAIWDLINHGQMVTGLLSPVQKIGFERLVYGVFGADEVASYTAACARRGVYSIPVECLDTLPKVLFGSVIGAERVSLAADHVLHSSGCVLSEETALCYAGLQDYRAKTAQGGVAVLFSTAKPESE